MAAGPPTSTTTPKPTWLAPERIITESAPATTSTTRAPAPAGARGATASPTTTAAVVEAAEPEEEVVVPATTPPATTPPTVPPTTVPETTTTTPPLALSSPAVASTAAPTAAPAHAPAHTPAHTEQGEATWFHAPDGSCAHRTAPAGTVIKVTRTSTGASTTCYVDQWGPEAPYRVIDLSMDTFEKLAPAEVGVINVVIEW